MVEYYVYILKSEVDGSYYIGYTCNLKERLRKHNCNHSGYTSKKKPYKIIYFETYSDKSKAIEREKKIKSYKGGDAFKKLCKIDIKD